LVAALTEKGLLVISSPSTGKVLERLDLLRKYGIRPADYTEVCWPAERVLLLVGMDRVVRLPQLEISWRIMRAKLESHAHKAGFRVDELRLRHVSGGR